MTRRRGLAGAAVALAAAAVAAGAPAPAAAAPTFRDGYGLRVVAQQPLDARLLTATVTTAALPGPANIRVLLPDGYDANPTRRYPVFYLLHGTSGGASDWTVKGDAERTTAGFPAIVVMPDIALNDGGGGWCTDWFNGGAYGPPEWETFHIDELIPWVDHNLRTVAARRGRAIAGLSQGGFCSMSYAARHPDLFSTALGYSGAPDISYDADDKVGSTLIINGTEVGLDRVPPNSMFGDRVTQEINWAAHDPATLANNLRETNIRLYTGNGQPGPLDPFPPDAGAIAIESAVSRDNEEFHNRLDALQIPSFYEPYGPGTHIWPYWARDLRESVGPIAAAFAHPPAPPSSVTYTAAEPRYAVYGWQVTMHRTAKEFSTLERARSRGFALAGSGSGLVVTPPYFAPRRRYRVALRGDTVDRTVLLTADRRGRLHVDVPLGPANPYTTTVTTAAARRGRRR